MSEFECKKHDYLDETRKYSCPACYADWESAEPKAPPGPEYSSGKEKAIAYIDKIAPQHSRTSCAEFDSWNAAFSLDGTLYNYCERCTLIRIAQLALGEIAVQEEDEG